MSSPRRTYLADATVAMLALLAAVVPIATAVAVIAPGQERALLHYGFAHVPHALDQTLTILRANLTVLLPLLAAAVFVQARPACRTATGRRLYTWFCDLIVAVPLLHNLVLPIASSVGAYGWRMIISMLPAGPLELCSFALAASVYLHSRRATLGHEEIAQSARVAVLSLAVLVAAAALETYA